MKLKTSGGKVFDIRVICPDLRSKNKVLIELEDDRPLGDIARDFDGLESMLKYDEDIAGVHEVYEGFTRLVGIRRNESAGTVRLTLEKGGASDA